MAAEFYARPSYMNGGAFTIYSGSRRQKGGGILGSIRNALMPAGRTAMKALKSLARNKTVRGLAKQAVKRGTQVLTNVAVDALQGQDIGQSFKRHGKEAALQAIVGDDEDEEDYEAPPKKRRKKKSKKLKQSNRRRQKGGKRSRARVKSTYIF